MEIRVAGTDLPEAMFTHEDRRVRVVQQIAREMRKLRDHLLCHHCMSLCRHKDAETWRTYECCDELPSIRRTPGSSHYLRVSGHPKELIKDRPSRIPRVGTSTLALKPFTAGSVERRVAVGGVNQDIRVDDEHYRPSMAWYRASRSAISTNVPPLWNVGRGGSSCRFFCDRNNPRRAVSTSSDIVRL
jgi:hypothetical protein